MSPYTVEPDGPGRYTVRSELGSEVLIGGTLDEVVDLLVSCPECGCDCWEESPDPDDEDSKRCSQCLAVWSYEAERALVLERHGLTERDREAARQDVADFFREVLDEAEVLP